MVRMHKKEAIKLLANSEILFNDHYANIEADDEDYQEYTTNEVVELLRKYKKQPHVIQYIADMMEL